MITSSITFIDEVFGGRTSGSLQQPDTSDTGTLNRAANIRQLGTYPATPEQTGSAPGYVSSPRGPIWIKSQASLWELITAAAACSGRCQHLKIKPSSDQITCKFVVPVATTMGFEELVVVIREVQSPAAAVTPVLLPRRRSPALIIR